MMKSAFIFASIVLISQAMPLSAIGEEDAEERARQFVELVDQGDFEVAWSYFDDQVALALTPAQLEDLWRGIVAQLGEFMGISDMGVSESKGYTEASLTCEFENYCYDMTLIFDEQGQIASIYFPNLPKPKISPETDAGDFPLEGATIIEGVPYVGQRTNFDCDSSSWSMIFGYFTGMGYEQFIYESGRGFRFGYLPDRLTVARPNALQDVEFLSDIYGLRTIFWSPEPRLDESQRWDSYLEMVRACIAEKSPVLTSVDPLHMPQFEEIWNASREDHGGHAIVLVGFDDDEKKIHFNDPQAELLGLQEEGVYADMSYHELKDAVSNTTGPKYYVSTIVRRGDGLGTCEREEAIRAENLRKLAGEPGSYQEYPATFEFGVKGWEALRKDLIDEAFDEMTMREALPNMAGAFYYYSFLTSTSADWALTIEEEGGEMLQSLSSLYESILDRTLEIYQGGEGLDQIIGIVDEIIDLESSYLKVG